MRLSTRHVTIAVMAVFAIVAVTCMVLPSVVALNNPKVGNVEAGDQNPLPVPAGDTATYIITINRGSGGGSRGAFLAEMSTNGLPSGASASFNPPVVSFAHDENTKTAILTITTLQSLDGNSYPFAVIATRSYNAQDYAEDSLTVLKVTTIPEYALGAFAALGACFVGFAVFKKRNSLSQLSHR